MVATATRTPNFSEVTVTRANGQQETIRPYTLTEHRLVIKGGRPDPTERGTTMATTKTRKTRTRKAAPKTAPKAAAKKEATEKTKAEERAERHAELREQAEELLGAGKTLKEVAETLEISAGLAGLLKLQIEVEPYPDTLNASQVAKRVVKDRNAGDSWGTLSVKTGLSEGAVRKIYEEESGTSASESDIGKGGRPRNGQAPKAKSAPKGKTRKSRKSRAQSTEDDGGTKTELSFEGTADEDEAFTEAVTDRTLTFKKGRGTESVLVAEVVKFGNSKAQGRGAVIRDTDGNEHKVPFNKAVSVE